MQRIFEKPLGFKNPKWEERSRADELTPDETDEWCTVCCGMGELVISSKVSSFKLQCALVDAALGDDSAAAIGVARRCPSKGPRTDGRRQRQCGLRRRHHLASLPRLTNLTKGSFGSPFHLERHHDY